MNKIIGYGQLIQIHKENPAQKAYKDKIYGKRQRSRPFRGAMTYAKNMLEVTNRMAGAPRNRAMTPYTHETYEI